MAEESQLKLIEFLEEVHDEQTFLKFVQALTEDRVDEIKKEKDKPSSPYGSGANGWENVTFESFLESASRWATDSSGGPRMRGQGKHKDSLWNIFAHFLYAGKIYE